MSVVSKTLYFKQKANELNQYKSWRMGLLFVFSGLVLFGFVWWPIQAERARLSQRQWEIKIAQKKAELNILQLRYQTLTSLTMLDQWAKKHGPWKSISANDVITL